MNKKILAIIPLFISSLVACSNNNSEGYDPFMVGDNLEVVSPTEAKMIANEAYNNLVYTSYLRKTTSNVQDDTAFYTGAFSSYATSTKTTVESEVDCFSNKIESKRNIRRTTSIGKDSIIEEDNTTIEEWYGVKPVKEGEPTNENYSLLRKTVDKYNGISATRFSSTDNFATKDNASIIWNRYLVRTIDQDYLTDTSIAFSNDFIYVRDDKHIVGYYQSSQTTTESSRLAPGKEDISYLKRIDDLSVIDFYEDDLLGIGWTVRTVSKRQVVTYLTSIDGKESSPIEISRAENVTSLYYDSSHSTSENIPQFELDVSKPFFISKFKYNDEKTDIVFDKSYRLENNNSYYQREEGFNGNAYYLEQKLDVGYYSFFNDEESGEYEKWGYDAIIANNCVNYIINPHSLNELDPAISLHPNVFYVTQEMTFSFRVVFDSEMIQISEFTVAIVAK